MTMSTGLTICWVGLVQHDPVPRAGQGRRLPAPWMALDPGRDPGSHLKAFIASIDSDLNKCSQILHPNTKGVGPASAMQNLYRTISTVFILFPVGDHQE